MSGTDQAAAVLSGRRGWPRRGKRELIMELCRDRSVLDLGCIQHSWRMSIDNPDWLHEAIRSVAASCTGVDYLNDDVEELRSRGYDIVYGDVLRDSPPGKYQVVTAGDLVEHLGNPGLLLDYIADALTDDGVAVITTPNAVYAAQFWTVIARGRPDISPEHAVLFDPFTFGKLVERSPLQIRDLYWLEPSWSAFWNTRNPAVEWLVRRPLHKVTLGLTAMRPYLNSDFAAVLEPRVDAPIPTPEMNADAVMRYLHVDDGRADANEGVDE
jgi:hypothetical protein